MKRAAGVVAVDERGMVWLIEPKDHFGGYAWTFPKGTVDAGETLGQAAEREAMEEAGAEVEIVAAVGVYRRTTSVATYFLARTSGGSPERAAHFGAEVSAIRAFTVRDAMRALNSPTDRRILSDAVCVAAAEGVVVA